MGPFNRGGDHFRRSKTSSGSLFYHDLMPSLDPSCSNSTSEPRIIFKVPRVIANQKEVFEKDDFFRRHSKEGEVRYTLFRDTSIQERQVKFLAGLREGHTEIAHSQSGFVLTLSWNPNSNNNNNPSNQSFGSNSSFCDFKREHGKVHLNSSLIINGVCVRWKGWIDLERLDGIASIQYDEESAKIEEAQLRRQIDYYNNHFKSIDGMIKEM